MAERLFIDRGWSDLKRLMFLHAAAGGPLTEYELTGNPVAFNTNVSAPLSGFTIPFLPVQQGTGDPSPQNQRPISGWQGFTANRSGVNMFNYNADNVKQETTTTGTTRAVCHTGIFGNGSKFALTAELKDPDDHVTSNVNCGIFVDGKARVDSYFIKADEAKRTTYLTPSVGQEILLIYTDSGVQTLKNNLAKLNVQIEPGDASTYTHYTGASYPVTFPATGKNLIHPTPYAGQLFNVQVGTDLAQTTVRASSEENGNTITVTVTHQWYGVVYSTDMLPPGTYNIHLEPGDEHCRVSSYVADKDFIALSRNSITSNNKVITLTETSRIVVTISNDNSEVGSVTLVNLQVESGESYTAWEPFTNTVYGGTLDAVTGVMSVEWAGKDLGTLNYVYAANLGGGAFWTNGIRGEYTPKNVWVGICSKYKYVGAYNKLDNLPSGIGYVYNNNVIVKDTSVTLDDPDEMKAALYGVILVYELATPLVYQLTPTQITTLIGDNIIWTDTNGENTVKYLKKG